MQIKVIVGHEAIRYATVFYKINEKQAIQLMAEDLEVAFEDIIVIPQIDYHIDLHLRAGLPGTIFLASFDSGYMMLDALTKKSSINKSDNTEVSKIDELKVRFQDSRFSDIGKQQTQNLIKTSQILQKNGFTIQSYPSIYFSKKIFPKSFVAINTLNNRYVTSSEGQVLNFMLGSGFRAIDNYISIYELNNGSDQTYFLGRLSAEWKNYGNKIIEKLHGGMGCLTNIQ
jgi:hypothetical protein